MEASVLEYSTSRKQGIKLKMNSSKVRGTLYTAKCVIATVDWKINSILTTLQSVFNVHVFYYNFYHYFLINIYNSSFTF